MIDSNVLDSWIGKSLYAVKRSRHKNGFVVHKRARIGQFMGYQRPEEHGENNMLLVLVFDGREEFEFYTASISLTLDMIEGGDYVAIYDYF